MQKMRRTKKLPKWQAHEVTRLRQERQAYLADIKAGGIDTGYNDAITMDYGDLRELGRIAERFRAVDRPYSDAEFADAVRDSEWWQGAGDANEAYFAETYKDQEEQDRFLRGFLVGVSTFWEEVKDRV